MYAQHRVPWQVRWADTSAADASLNEQIRTPRHCHLATVGGHLVMLRCARNGTLTPAASVATSISGEPAGGATFRGALIPMREFKFDPEGRRRDVGAIVGSAECAVEVPPHAASNSAGKHSSCHRARAGHLAVVRSACVSSDALPSDVSSLPEGREPALPSLPWVCR